MADSNSHKALGYALLAYITAAIAVVTLVPFEFVVPQKLQIALHGDVADVLTNILLFVPLGFFDEEGKI